VKIVFSSQPYARPLPLPEKCFRFKPYLEGCKIDKELSALFALPIVVLIDLVPLERELGKATITVANAA
jgi:hypothetical protein